MVRIENVLTGPAGSPADTPGSGANTPMSGSTLTLPFELRKRSGRFLDPEPRLRAWDRHS